MGSKKTAIANLNVVFGEDEKPMLEYFDSIIFPAFKQDFKKISGDNKYTFRNIEITTDAKNDFLLTGIIVKDTVIEIKSKLDDEGNLIDTNESYPTAPYSLFIIHLKNHRMIIIKNQKGSPELKSFSSAFEAMIKKYILKENKTRKNADPRTELLPSPQINIVGIPLRESLEEILKNVKKIKKFTLRFYPLNGDIDYNEIFSDLRKKVGSNKGDINFNSPTSAEGIIDVIDNTQGTAKSEIEVVYNNNKSGKIVNERISENIEIDIPQSKDISYQIQQAINKTQDIDSLNYVSENNEKIYHKNKGKIIPFVKKS